MKSGVWILEDDSERLSAFAAQFPRARATDDSSLMLSWFRSGRSPSVLFLDHDLDTLGVDYTNTGMRVVEFLERNILPIDAIIVHSLNITGNPATMVKRLQRAGYQTVRMPFMFEVEESLRAKTFKGDFADLVEISAFNAREFDKKWGPR